MISDHIVKFESIVTTKMMQNKFEKKITSTYGLGWGTPYACPKKKKADGRPLARLGGVRADALCHGASSAAHQSPGDDQG